LGNSIKEGENPEYAKKTIIQQSKKIEEGQTRSPKKEKN